MSNLGDTDEEVLDLSNVVVIGRFEGTHTPFFLVGWLCTVRSYNSYALLDVMMKAFKARKKFLAHEWGNWILIFTFDDKYYRDWVLKEQP